MSIVVSVSSFVMSSIVFMENRKSGWLHIQPPTRYGILRGTNHANTSDKLLLCFALHNDGSVFRCLDSITLEVEDSTDHIWDFRAIAAFDKMRCSSLGAKGLLSDPNYSLVTAMAIDKWQFAVLNLLFFYTNDVGWVDEGNVFRLHTGCYRARLFAHSHVGSGIARRQVRYASEQFQFRVHYLPPDGIIDTSTDLEVCAAADARP